MSEGWSVLLSDEITKAKHGIAVQRERARQTVSRRVLFDERSEEFTRLKLNRTID